MVAQPRWIGGAYLPTMKFGQGGPRESALDKESL